MKGEHMDQTQKDLLERYWQEQQEVFTRLQEMGGEQFFSSIENLPTAFELKDLSLRCMDEGTPGGIHMAGSGILSKESAVDLVKQAGVNGIFSHAGCGAAALYAKEAGLDVNQSDDYGVHWAKELAEKIGVPYQGHISSENMVRPPDFHIARVAYYDGTGQFDPSLSVGLPPGFVISRRFLTGDYAQKEAEIAAAIALGNHGFGSKITNETPFYLVAVGDNRQNGLSKEALEAELSAITQASNGRVITTGFTAPI